MANVRRQHETGQEEGPDRRCEPDAVLLEPKPSAGNPALARQPCQRTGSRDRQDNAGDQSVPGGAVTPRGMKTHQRNGRSPHHDRNKKGCSHTGSLNSQQEQTEAGERQQLGRDGARKTLSIRTVARR